MKRSEMYQNVVIEFVGLNGKPAVQRYTRLMNEKQIAELRSRLGKNKEITNFTISQYVPG